MEENKIIEGLNTAIIGMSELQNKILSGLPQDKKVLFNKFQTDMAYLYKRGDLAGVEKLKEKFKEEMK